MKRVTELNNCVVSDCYHQEAKTVTDEKTKQTQSYAASTRVTLDFMGGQFSLKAVDPNFKTDTNKPGIATIEEELLLCRYNSYGKEKTALAWVPSAVVGFKVSPAR